MSKYSCPNDETLLDELQRETFAYFLHETNPQNGLVRDKTNRDSPSSIAATGLALSSYPVGVERGFLTRADAVERTLVTLRFFMGSRQDKGIDATGYRGFYYHFLDMGTGSRAWKCELSTIDTALLVAGMLTAAMYFDGEGAAEREIRDLAEILYRRVDWTWACNGKATLSNGWRPEKGFLSAHWRGYCEALILYILALGSPSHPLKSSSYAAWTTSYRWKKIYGIELLYAGPLFIHQFSHLWVDFRGVCDRYMRNKGIDYFENSRRATLVQRLYAIRNPQDFKSYGQDCWGITASDGPGPMTRKIAGRRRKFFGYRARGVPFGPDDGTLAPWAVVASLPFAPEIVLPAIRHLTDLRLRESDLYGFKATFNSTYSTKDGKPWTTPWHYGLNQGPIVMAIENYRTGLLWKLMSRCPFVIRGLQQAGFRPTA